MRLKGASRAIYEYIGEHGVPCRCSILSMAADTEYDPKTVIRVISKLEREGRIERDTTTRPHTYSLRSDNV